MTWLLPLFCIAATLTPPMPSSAPAALYPDGETTSTRVILLVTIAADGSVSDVQVEESGGPAFDVRAISVVRTWRYEPARRDGVAIASRLHVPFEFVAKKPAPVPASAPVVDLASSRPAEEEVIQVSVRGQRRPQALGASDFTIERKIIEAAPHRDAGDLLRTAPGVYVSRPEGDAVAHQIFLRGFDAEHGQDIELTMAGIAINRVSHIHGQGYADLNLIMPEVVRSLRVSEGIYDVRQGDFAVAGSIDFDLGVQERGLHSSTRYGRFNLFRQSLVYAPRGEAEETFGGAFISRSDGFGQSRASLSGGAIAQYAFSLPRNVRLLVHASAHGARAGLAGVLRYDDIERRAVDFYGTYADASAQAQSALSARAQAMIQLDRPTDGGGKSQLQLAFVTTDFSLRSNYTGYMQRSVQRPEWVGRGDLIEQRNTDFTLALKASHRFAPFQWSVINGVFETGVGYRADFVSQAQSLLQQPRNETWDKRVDAGVHASDIHLWGELHLRFPHGLSLRGGLRGDVLYYNVDDRLANLTASYRSEQYFPGYRRTAIGAAVGPRASFEWAPVAHFKLIASYGEGYRSPQARVLEEGENAPFAKVRSTELGLDWRVLSEDRLTLQAAGFATWLSQDLAFDAAEGRLERVGPTSRKGGVLRATTQPLSWLFASASVTYVYATIDAPPVATTENPTPPYVNGQLLPYVPPWVGRSDVKASGPLASFCGGTLAGSIGAGVSVLSARPLPYGLWSTAFATLDLNASLRWRMLELGVEAFNVTNTRYAANDYSFVSNWANRPVPSALPTRHISAGPPFSINGFFGVHL
jgi:iron complex outermembrane recepter protein